MQHTDHVDIEAPRDRVFYWIDDDERVKKCITGAIENRNIEVTEDRVGSTFHQVFEENGQLMEFDGIVTEYVKDERLGVHMKGKMFQLDVLYVLEDHDGGTRVTQHSKVVFNGFWKLVGPIMAFLCKKQGAKKLQDDFARLKDLCENDNEPLESAA
ncbi:MAG: SRPBCC family protein [Planctomycetota bacterium]